jgi:hypothetical protein
VKYEPNNVAPSELGSSKSLLRYGGNGWRLSKHDSDSSDDGSGQSTKRAGEELRVLQ